MNTLSVWEFSQLCEDRKFSTYQYEEEKQHKRDLSVGYSYKIISTEIYCVIHPNIICFKAGEQYLRFSDVRYINIISDHPDDGFVFDIACRNITSKGKCKKYRLIAK